jgi:hypothetical protein
MGCVVEGVCLLEPIVVYAPSDCATPGCPGYTDPKFVIDPWSGGGGGGGGSWGGYDPYPPDPCNTGDAFLDSPGVQESFDTAWKPSNVAGNLADRKEVFGWIVQTSAGYRIDVLGAGNFCGFDGEANAPAEGPGAIVGFFHTHPYSVGETILTCTAQMTVGGSAVYKGEPSDVDRAASVDLGNALGRGEALPGVIIDNEGIRFFRGTDLTKDDSVARCGY